MLTMLFLKVCFLRKTFFYEDDGPGFESEKVVVHARLQILCPCANLLKTLGHWVKCHSEINTMSALGCKHDLDSRNL